MRPLSSPTSSFVFIVYVFSLCLAAELCRLHRERTGYPDRDGSSLTGGHQFLPAATGGARCRCCFAFVLSSSLLFDGELKRWEFRQGLFSLLSMSPAQEAAPQLVLVSAHGALLSPGCVGSARCPPYFWCLGKSDVLQFCELG